MSGYPPQPTFGTPFNPNPQVEQTFASYDPIWPQYSYPYQNSSYLYSQGQLNGMPIVPQTNANSHSFRSNAQDVRLSSGDEGNGGPHPPFGGQLQHGAFQSTLLPPTSFAHGSASYENQHFTQPSTNSQPPSKSRPAFSDSNVTVEVQSTRDEDSVNVPPALSELEDGELDDGEVEVDRPIGQSRASTTTSSGMSQHKWHEIKGSADGHRVTNAPYKPLPGLIQGSLAATGSRVSPAPQQPTSSTRNGFVGNLDHPLTTRTAEKTSTQQPLSTDTATQESEKASLNLVDQKLVDAKTALLDLHSQGFDFDRIVNAGLNPDVLRKLYTNMGIPVTASSNALQQKIVEPPFVATDVPTENKSSAAMMSIRDEQPILPQQDLTGDILRNDKVSHLVNDEGKIDDQPANAAAKEEAKTVQNQVSLAKSSKPSTLNPLGKASGIKAGETRVLDRKEYIARMLAAKAGKPALSAPTPVSSKISTITDLRASAQVRSSAAAAASGPTAVKQALSESADIARGTQKKDSDVEAKRKAQTDLARQKIEALKLRENTQQQIRSTTSNDAQRHIEQSSAKSFPNIPVESSVPTPRPLLSRQSSYFSPASQKPPFSIPGLFMTLDAPEPVDTSQPLPNGTSAVSPRRVSNAIFGSSQGSQPPQAAISAKPSTANKTQFPESPFDLNSAPSETIATITSSSRKRQKASDFIDSPSTRVKRPLGQQETTSLIIDISDDELNNSSSEEESLVVDLSDRRNTLPTASQAKPSGNGKEMPGKSLVPLDDFSPRTKAVMTPPAAQVFGQSGDLKGLKSKEMEIELMNRKIAELEQRIAVKAKQNTSRSHSPRTSSRDTFSPTLDEALQHINGTSDVPLSVSESQIGDTAPDENRKSSVAPAEGNDSAAAEQLNAERQLEEVELAKAEVERSLAAEITRAATANDSLAREKREQNPQTEEASKFLEGGQPFREEQQRVQDEEQLRLNESQTRPARGDTGSSGPYEVDHPVQEQERKRLLDEQWQARKSEIELGLPLLDAEVEKTRKRLESLRKEIAVLETELQKGIKGRQGLIEELNSASRSREALAGPTDLDSRDVADVPKYSTTTERVSVLRESTTPVEMIPNTIDSDPTQPLDAAVNGRAIQDKDSSTHAADDRMSLGEVEEDTMDISRSDVHEAELSLYSPKPLTEDQDILSFTGDGDGDDENYEPPIEIEINQRQGPDLHAVLKKDLQSAKDDIKTVTQNRPPADQAAELIERPTSDGPSSTANADKADTDRLQQSVSRSPFPANASDPDDYEPPEPALLGEEESQPLRMWSVESDKSFSPPDVDTNENVAPTSSKSKPTIHQEKHVLGSNRRAGHFTTYESPLKQFKSFRYHPHYLEEVSNGFRSLTYSHTIDPNIPLCLYELNGVCNDDSCQSQHLRSIALSDDKILVDLGAQPDNGASPDKFGSDEFGDGLRKVIHDIRSRKIRDFNIVAGEITAYRAKFLGDRSKILPL